MGFSGVKSASPPHCAPCARGRARELKWPVRAPQSALTDYLFLVDRLGLFGRLLFRFSHGGVVLGPVWEDVITPLYHSSVFSSVLPLQLLEISPFFRSTRAQRRQRVVRVARFSRRLFTSRCHGRRGT